MWEHAIETKKGFCVKEREGISAVKEREERGAWVYSRTIKKGIY